MTDPIVGAIEEADTLEEALGLALGAASACWDRIELAGTFDSERAQLIGDTLLRRVRSYVQ